jgi:hypothetical protein
MGLSLQVGYWGTIDNDSWLDSQLTIINSILLNHKLQPWGEPKIPVLERSRTENISIPYSWLDSLKAAFLSRLYDPTWVANAVEELGEHLDFDSHLLNHSDCEGFYIPLDCSDFIIDDKAPGGILGSSYRLLDELILLAPALGIDLSSGELSDLEARRINDLINDSTSEIEPLLTAWIVFYEAARLSVKHRRILVLC